MNNNDNTCLQYRAEKFLEYLNGISAPESKSFTEEEVQDILNKENETAKQNYENAVISLREEHKRIALSNLDKRFVVYWGYPGAGKSFMANKLQERFVGEEGCQPFQIVDKDEYRELFPNLFEHLKDGHINEFDKFAGITTDFVRFRMDFELNSGKNSILSIGSMGAGSEFQDNALKALEHGYKPAAVYMAVKPEIAFFSGVYRSAVLYDKIIFNQEQLYPRLIIPEYFSKLKKHLPNMISRIDEFQKNNAKDVDLLVVNRENELLYDTRKDVNINVLEAISREENRELSEKEKLTLGMQLFRIEQSLRYRIDNGIYTPQNNELEMIKTAVENIIPLIKEKERVVKFTIHHNDDAPNIDFLQLKRAGNYK